ncbi:MAG: helix-turn-helix domain-containing protein [bacterium]|nr:helix-turn-helix domain-containing protein [bacterium]
MSVKQISLPDTRAVELAASAAAALKAYLSAHPSGAARLRLGSAGSETQVVVPEAAFALLVAMLEELARGNTVAMAAVQEELTTQQAADLLNVSRPYLIGLLEDGKIPFHRVGNRRKLSLADLLEYKRRDTAHREEILDQLTAEAQEMGLYD